MSLGCLAELVSVTGDAVRSLSIHKSESNNTSSKVYNFNAGSPFESPKSFQSVSVKNEHFNEVELQNTQPASKVPSCESAETNGIHNSDSDKNFKSLGLNAGDISFSKLTQCTVMGSSSETHHAGIYVNANENNDKKLSIAKTQLKEIPSPIEYTHDQHSPRSQDSVSSARSKISGDQKGVLIPTIASSTEQVFVERHEPYADTEHFNNKRILVNNEGLKQSIHFLSSSGEQPEIIDVHQRVATITSGISQSSDDSAEDVWSATHKLPGSHQNQSRGSNHFLSGKNELGHGLKQGALNKGNVDATRASLFNDVYISHFGLTEKQRGLKQALAKRSESNRPKKKFVQPQIIRQKLLSDSETNMSKNSHPATGQTVGAATDSVVTAAAAASAAVAAAQPFLKTQFELETRMQQLLAQISELQQKTGITGAVGKSGESENRIQDVERQVAELNERRFEHLENLQQQQMQLQAQLLFMSQSRSHNNHGHTSRPFQISRIPQAAVRHPDTASHQAEFTSYRPSAQSQPIYKPSTHKQSVYNLSTHKQPTFNPDMISKHHNYLNEVRELQGSHLDTPAPRDRIPKPAPYTLPHEPNKNFGFLQELLAPKDNADKDTTYSVMGDYSSPGRLESDKNNSARGKRRDQSPVDKARQLITSLSNLEKETADSIWGSRDGLNKMEKVQMDVDLGPAPLDRYLKYPEKEGSPYPKLGHHSRQKKRLLENVDNFVEAKNVLRQLEETRLTLENNIDQVVRSRRDVHLFTAMPGSETDRVNDGQLRIEKLVTKNISALEGDIQRDVLRGLALAEAEKLAAQHELEIAVKRKLEQGKSIIVKGQADRTARLSYSKPNMLATAALNNRGKENRGSKVKLPPKPAAIKDEATRVRTYGKPEYLRGRTTIRDPYLHFKNPKKGVAAKSSLTNLNESARSREGRSRSPPRQEPIIDPMPRQFYFSPTRGYIPLGGGDTAPIQGQLVSMAIPLGAPRLEPGVRRSAAPVTRSSSGPVSSTPVPVTAARNVAMVSFPVDKDGQGYPQRQPELTKQVLPPVDIDSISPSSSQRSDIHFISPQQDNANMTFMFDSRNEADESKLTYTEKSFELEQSGEGIRLPGYKPKIAPYSGPSFPPKTSRPSPGWAAGAGEVVAAQQMSDVMAEDLRRRDMLENNAVIWLEQELMAQVLSQIPQQVTEKPADVSQAGSEASDKDESLLVTDMIGQSGMQLFIDAGQPIDNALVQELIKDVIREKILAMMAQRETEGEGQVRVRNEVEEAIEDKKAEEVATGSYRVPTPQPTPESSPIPFPKQTRQQLPQPVTPPQSPPPDGYRFKPLDPEPQVPPEPIRQPLVTGDPPRVLAIVESETETSLSLDISEELQRVAAKGKPAEVEERVDICHDVATPPLSPPLVTEEEKPEVFPERQVTPPASPPVSKTPPRVRTPSPKRKEPVIETEEEESQDEEILEQPQPIRISVGVGDDRPLTADTQVQHMSSSPKRPLTPEASVSETTSLSTESTTTETVNEFISEGQWLLSYSEGQVVGAVNYEAIRKEITGRGYEHIVDVSTASTLRDTDDLDLDVEGTQSEGEFLHAGFLDPDKDPRLEVLAQLQKRTIHVQQMYPGPAPTVVMSSTGRSVGEMSIGQVPPSRIAAERARKYGEHVQQERGGRARSPSSTLEKNLEENYIYKSDTQHRNDRRQDLDQQYNRAQSPQQDTYSRTASPPQKQHSRTPSPQQEKKSRTPPQQDRRSKTPPLQQRQQKFAGTKTKSQVQYQPVLSEGRPLSARGRTLAGKQSRRRSSDVRLSQNSDPGVRRSDSTYNSQSLSRSADGDSFRPSGNGFLTSSLKSRNSALKKSVEFDLSGTQQSSKRGSRDLSEDMGPSQSAALTFTEDSLDEAELHRIGAATGTSSYAGTYRMSVTIPSGAEGEDSEISEVDLSNKSDK